MWLLWLWRQANDDTPSQKTMPLAVTLLLSPTKYAGQSKCLRDIATSLLRPGQGVFTPWGRGIARGTSLRMTRERPQMRHTGHCEPHVTCANV
jgi:hypothetical protein